MFEDEVFIKVFVLIGAAIGGAGIAASSITRLVSNKLWGLFYVFVVAAATPRIIIELNFMFVFLVKNIINKIAKILILKINDTLNKL